VVAPWIQPFCSRCARYLSARMSSGELILEGETNDELLKPLSAVSAIRRYAAQFAPGDMRHYYVGLLFQAGRILVGRGSFSPDRLRRRGFWHFTA